MVALALPLNLNIPMDVIVPKIVDMTDAKIAILTV